MHLIRSIQAGDAAIPSMVVLDQKLPHLLRACEEVYPATEHKDGFALDVNRHRQ
jgi:hypothetical protein